MFEAPESIAPGDGGNRDPFCGDRRARRGAEESAPLAPAPLPRRRWREPDRPAATGIGDMAFPPGFLDELRSRISLPDLIGRRVKLVRRGREHAGLCPFHHEKTPSFYVVEDKSFFHCFGCGAHGDAIGFVMRANNLDFLEAVEQLAGRAGLPVPEATPEERGRAQRQKTLLEVLEAAAGFYEHRLWAPTGERALEYLRGRELDDDTIRRFRLGWAPGERQALRRALGADFSEALLVEAGLLHRPPDGDPCDYFRGRVMFPIGDRAGRIIAFGARVLGGGQPKYLNSPEHPLFAKGRVLYGWSTARAAGTEHSQAIVTEGYMDVIALNRAGFATAVAPLGTALTESQLHELWRLGPEPILCFDGDDAGRRAALRALHRALPLLRPGCSLRFAALPAGEDPDSLVRSGGPPAFAQVLAAAQSLSDMLWESEVRGAARDTPERIARIRSRLSEHVRMISDPTVRFEFETLFKRRCDPWPARRKTAARVAAVHDGPPRPIRPPGKLRREILLRILLQYPGLIDEVAGQLARVEIPEPELDKLRAEILHVATLQRGLDAPALRQHLLLNGFAATIERLLSRSVDAGFLVRRSDLSLVREDCARVIRLLIQDDASGTTETGGRMIDDVAPESWERFRAVKTRALQAASGEGEAG
jgi:DNA primase